MKFKGKKKASLSLSVNAIVILVVAITVLGLSLTFVRGLFGQAEEKVSEAINIADLSNPPTRDDPIKINPPEIDLRQRTGSETITINVMNAFKQAAHCKLIEPEVETPPGADGRNAPTPALTFSESCRSLEKDQVNQMKMSISGDDPEKDGDPAEGVWIYTLKFNCWEQQSSCISGRQTGSSGLIGEATKDLVIKVQS